MTEQCFALTDSDLDEVSGGVPNLGGLRLLPNVPGRAEGLYVGGCISPVRRSHPAGASGAAWNDSSAPILNLRQAA